MLVFIYHVWYTYNNFKNLQKNIAKRTIVWYNNKCNFLVVLVLFRREKICIICITGDIQVANIN